VTLIDRVYEGEWAPGIAYGTDGWIDADWRPGNLGGGNLHIFLDDWNIDDGYFAGEYYDGASTPEFMTGPPHQLAVERACYDCLKRMTEQERASALAWYEGLITATVGGAPTQRAWYVSRT